MKTITLIKEKMKEIDKRMGLKSGIIYELENRIKEEQRELSLLEFDYNNLEMDLIILQKDKGVYYG